MEDSMNHLSMNKAVVDSKETTESPEESGWTSYFEDFSNHRENSFSSSYGTPSMVSDAASSPAWKSSPNNQVGACSSIGGSPHMPKKLTLKKTRAKEIYHDDSLEDTASSPVNSPKVSDLRPIDMNPRKTNDHFTSSLGKGGILEQYGGLETDEGCEMNFNGKNNDCKDLKKRGLCLVPLSMLVNYLG